MECVYTGECAMVRWTWAMLIVDIGSHDSIIVAIDA